MDRLKRKRNRGIILTDKGWSRLQVKKKERENQDSSPARYTIEALSELTGLVYGTVFKIVKRKEGVDKRSLVKFLMAFDLELRSDDYISAASAKKVLKRNPVEKTNAVDWDREIEIPFFFGREAELTTLEEWIAKERCRLVCVRGLGGIGKTALCVKLLERVKQQFEFVIWRSLQEPLTLRDFLIDLNRTLSFTTQIENADIPNTGELLRRLIKYLRSHRCLIVLDGLEHILQENVICGRFIQQYRHYSRLIESAGEVAHQSCLLLVTREQPKEVSFRQGKKLPVRSLELQKLQPQEGRKIIANFGFIENESAHNQIFADLTFHPFDILATAQNISYSRDHNIFLLSKKKSCLNSTFVSLIKQQIKRLSASETELLHHLATFKHPKSFSELRKNATFHSSPSRMMESLDSLVRRSLIVKKDNKFAIEKNIARYVIYAT